MQLPAEQTSLEPLPHRVGPDGRRPFKSQSARGDGSRFTSDTIWAQRSRVPDSQAPKVDLNKLPANGRQNYEASETVEALRVGDTRNSNRIGTDNMRLASVLAQH